jgi:hypothetical protein
VMSTVLMYRPSLIQLKVRKIVIYHPSISVLIFQS